MSSNKRKHSSVWSHFDEDGEQKAKCKHCKSSISTSGGSTGNLSRHLKLKHPLIIHTVERQQTVDESTVISDELQNNDQPTTTSTSMRTHQPNIIQYLRKPPPIRKVEQIDRQVLKMVAKGHHALRIVEEPEFKNLIHAVSQCPNYNLPSRKSLSCNILPTVHAEILEKIKIEIQSASGICLTTDGWTSKSNKSFLAVTAHFIDNETILRSHLISCEEFIERHTADNLCNYLKKVASDFQITNKITAVVSDNAHNIAAAIRQSDWRGVGCFAHSLNLVVQAGIVEINDILSKVKRVVEYFRKSSQGLKRLQETQKQMNLPDLKLKQDVITRWNSSYEMLHRLLQIKNAVISTLSIIRPDLSLTSEDWENIQEIMPILKPFYEVTVEISAEKNVTLSKVIVLTNLLEGFLSKCHSTNPKISSMLIIMKKEVFSRFANLECNSIYAESTLLDPRFKKKGFKNQSNYQHALKSLTNKVCDIILPINSEEISNEDTVPSDNSSIWSDYDREFNRNIRPDNNGAALRELEQYINEDYVDRKSDPLLWWSNRKMLYPRVYKYALKRLCIVATSVPCERIFSATGQIINERRTLLTSKKVSSLIFLHNNM